MSTTIHEVIKDMIWDERKGFFENLFEYIPYFTNLIPGGRLVNLVIMGALEAVGYGPSDLGKKIDEIIGGRPIGSVDLKDVAQRATSELGLEKTATASIAIAMRNGMVVTAIPNLPEHFNDVYQNFFNTKDPDQRKLLYSTLIKLMAKLKDSELRSVLNRQIKDDNLHYKLLEEAAKRQSFSERERAIHERDKKALDLKLRGKSEEQRLRSDYSESEIRRKRELATHETDEELRRQREMRRMQNLPTTPEEHERERKRLQQKRKDDLSWDLKREKELAYARQGKSLLGQRIKNVGVAGAIFLALLGAKKIYDAMEESKKDTTTAETNEDGSPSSSTKEVQSGPISDHITSGLESILSR